MSTWMIPADVPTCHHVMETGTGRPVGLNGVDAASPRLVTRATPTARSCADGSTLATAR